MVGGGAKVSVSMAWSLNALTLPSSDKGRGAQDLLFDCPDMGKRERGKGVGLENCQNIKHRGKTSEYCQTSFYICFYFFEVNI